MVRGRSMTRRVKKQTSGSTRGGMKSDKSSLPPSACSMASVSQLQIRLSTPICTIFARLVKPSLMALGDGSALNLVGLCQSACLLRWINFAALPGGAIERDGLCLQIDAVRAETHVNITLEIWMSSIRKRHHCNTPKLALARPSPSI